jgi:glycosyltransferase involved in cell wall biosynthesis
MHFRPAGASLTMRILHVIATLDPAYGGPANIVPPMCAALARRGHGVEIFTHRYDDADAQKSMDTRDGVKTTWHTARGLRSYPISAALARSLRQRISDFDVVHVHGLYRFHTLLASRVCRRRQVPYVIQAHGTLDPYHRAIRRWRKALYCLLIENGNLAAASAIQYTTTREQRFAVEAGVRTPGYVIPIGVEPSLFEDGYRDSDSPEVVQQLIPEAQGRVLVTFLGRLTEKKGLDVLCNAFSVVFRGNEDAHLVIAGPDDEGLGADVHRWVADSGIGGRVSLTGIVTGQAKKALLCASTVFVLPSKDENFGVAVVEALAARVAVVVTPGVALHEELERAEAALVVERSPEAVSRAILRLLRDDGLRRRLGENGRSLVEHTYSWDRISEQLERMYMDAIENRAKSNARVEEA